ncbi:GNAT family N-acetyltransferase [Mucilaginibacter sp. CSA2-8R]|uniref:GNAT family N-acetyltransferase n=1 Tax=Mucilaginibacter sp. CSA2-8R TaxID=3141542 RepID=UPI00315D27BE
MKHPLDNPAWHALQSGNKSLARGNELYGYFDAEVSPFVGLREANENNLLALYYALPTGSVKLLALPMQISISKPWTLLSGMDGFQMIYQSTEILPLNADKAEILPLTDAHIPQMLALTKLTNPGPFGSKTIAFGHYTGIFEGEQLVAMAGQRLHAVPYAEISAVCTHPDHLGKGYAKQLLSYQVNRVLAASGIPYLHVRHDNYRAIQVYESLSFEKRIPVYFHVLQKAE